MREQQQGNVGDRYRHVRHHPVFGTGRRVVEGAGVGAVGRGGSPGPGQVPRRVGGGPGRVRPAVVPLPSRPGQPPRPGTEHAGAPGAPRTLTVVRRTPVRTVAGVAGRRAGHRLLERRPRPVAVGRRTLLLRRMVAGVGLVVVAALVVVSLGLVADAVAAARPAGSAALPGPSGTSAPSVAAGTSGGGERIVTVDAPGTVWDLAGRIEPGATREERAALVGRIVTVNALVNPQVHPGEVLRVPSARPSADRRQADERGRVDWPDR